MSQLDPKEIFLLEAEDLLAVIEESALDLEANPEDREALNRLFRAFHTLKGSGSMFGFDAVADFTHHIENALDLSREGKLEPDPALIALILESKDQVKFLMDHGPDEASRSILDRLETLLRDNGPGTIGSEEAPGDPSNVAASAASDQPKRYAISFQPNPGITTNGLDPAALFDELRQLGACEVHASTEKLPQLEQLEPDHCYLNWSISLLSKANENAVRDVFIFVEDDCDLAISTEDNAGAKPDSTPSPTRSKAAASEPAAAKKSAPAQSTVRVTSDKLDRLVNLVGELVMNQSRLSQVASDIDSSELGAPVEEIERLVSELRDSVLGIRMMPIGSTFSRFRRLVHDLSQELGKSISLATEGEETELDKTVLDQLGDPLVHLIRNSIDHGIESPERRQAAGKPANGSIRLSAAHEGAHVLVTVEDDGGGLDPERIRAKAVEKGLVAPDAELDDKSIFNLILLPGFSTAKDVTNVSGRGVGMDVVKRQIESLGGEITLSSSLGKGTRVVLTLPLTLAIIDGLLVEIDRDRFILPMSAVTENVEITPAERSAHNGRNLVNVRGELIPYIRLREAFSLPDEGPAIEKVVITNHDKQRLGFVVDRVLGSHQTVIQSMGKLYEDIDVVSGATIMGDGRVALILDIAGLVAYDADVSKRQGQRHRPPSSAPHAAARNR